MYLILPLWCAIVGAFVLPLLWPISGRAQQPPPLSMTEALLGRCETTRAQVETQARNELQAADARLKWVLDNWVPLKAANDK